MNTRWLWNPRSEGDPLDIWRSRFDFFSAYGLPSSSPQARAAYQRLPLRSKLRIRGNGPALVFGPIYYFVKGMWRKALTLLAVQIVLGVVLDAVGVAGWVDSLLEAVFYVAMMLLANYAYFLHVVAGSRSWNPLEGFGRRRHPVAR